MELSVYDVIKGIIATPKSLFLRKHLGKITFEVNQHANKIIVREAVEKIWNVKVRDVRILNQPGKRKIVKKREYILPDKKKAIITLKPGYFIDLPDQIESIGVQHQVSQKKVKE